MQLKDATRIFGSVGLIIPLFLIILTAADPAFACPEHTSKVAYRTKSINTRTVSTMPTTVISYRAPASYRRCGANLYDTRGAKYVAVRNHRSGSGAQYVAVRNGESYRKLKQVRYVAVPTIESPRYVAVRHRYPIHRIDDTRYAEIRSGYRRGNGVVQYIDVGSTPKYVAVRRVPAVRYVAVDRDNSYYDRVRTKYVAVRNIDSGCTRAVALRSCLDEVETTSAKRVVLRNDDGYSTRTKYVAVRDEIDDDEYIALPRDNGNEASYVEYRPAAYSSDSYVAPVAISTRTITYDPDIDDDDDQAFIDDGDVTYVANSEDACTLGALPVKMRSKAVSYVPAAYVDDDSYVDTDVAYIRTNHAAPLIRRLAVEDDDDDDYDVTYIPVNNADDVELKTVSYVPVKDVELKTVSYVPVDDAEDVEMETVSYVPVAEVEDIGMETVSYVPVRESNVETVSYVPVSNVNYVAEDACPIAVSNVEPEPIYVADTSTVLVEEVDDDLVAGLHSTRQIASGFGYRDGFEDGREAALEGDLYHPENSGDYEKATEGYEDEFGDKDVYKDAYRSSYLKGYSAGFNSGAA